MKKQFSETTPLNIGMYVGWHIHGADFAQKILSYPDCQLVAVYDEDPVRGKDFADTYSCRYVPGYQELLDNSEIDAVIICSATALHAEHVVLAAQNGKHIYIEKAPFSTVSGARKAANAVKTNQVHFTFSDPVKRPDTLFAKDMIDSGKLGAITGVRMRAVHTNALNHKQPDRFFNKTESGGGALIDMGCKCVHTLAWLLGEPVSVVTSMSDISETAIRFQTEDNVVAVYRFSNGALGILESSWVSPSTQSALDVYGTAGTIHIRNREVSYCLEDGIWTDVPSDQLPPPLTHPLRDWVNHIRRDLPDTDNTIDEALILTKMLETAYLANDRQIAI